MAEVLARTPAALWGGLDERETLHQGPPAAIAAEVRAAIREAGGRRLIVGTESAPAIDTPPAHFRAARRAVESGEESVLKKILDSGEEIECEHVEKAAADGDAVAARIWDEACKYLALGCVMMQHLTNPQRIVLAGGMNAAGDKLFGPLRRHFDELTWKIVDDQPEIMPATLGNNAGLIGAAGCAKMAKEEGELVE